MSKPLVLFLHGGGLSGWMWQPQVTALTAFDCVTPDLPEHGDNRGTHFSLDSAAGFLEGWLDANAPGRPVHVVGLSIGGTVALTLARRRPEQMASLMLSSTSLGPLPGGRLVDWLTVLTLPLMKTGFVVRRSARAFGLPETLYPSFERDMERLTLPTYRRMNAVFDEFQAQDVPRLEGVRALVLAGEREAGFIRNNQRKICDALADSTGYVVPGGGHTWNFQLPELFNQTVRAWVLGEPLPTALIPL